jgi:starvation-inducible outer membrane lipoprotein
MKRIALIACVLLAGCVQIPAGVQMDDEEAKACEQAGCTVWTEDELRELIRQVYRKGYDAGVKSI